MKKTTSKLLASTILGGTLICASPAAAQSGPQGTTQESGTEVATDDAGDEIIVTGIRESLGAARDIKRNSTQFVDSVVADDIGKLPDRNVAESLARVSGVQVDRGIGEGSNVSVRGLRQNVFLYNGRAVSDATGRGGAGLDTLQSSTYGLLALVPSELISQLNVTKLAGSDQIAGGLGGIVDIQTRMPLNGPSQIAGKLTGVYSDLSRKAGFETFGLISQKFANDTIGILISGSYNQRDISQHGLNTFSGYSRFTDSGGMVRFGLADVRPEEIDDKRTNLGLSAVVQWQPSPGIDISLDSFYSKLKSDRSRHWLSFSPTGGLSNARYSSNNILLSGTATGPVLTNTEFAVTDADIWSSALRGKFDITDNFSANVELSYGKSTSSAHQVYFRLQPVVGITPTINFDLANGAFGSYAISGINVSDPQQLRFTILFDNTFRARNEDIAGRVDFTHNLDNGFFKALRYGLRMSDSDSLQNPLRADVRPAGGIVASTIPAYTTLYSSPRFAEGQFVGLPRSFLAASNRVSGCAAFTDIPAVSQHPQCLDPVNNTNALSSTFRIKESYTEGYGKIDFDTDLGNANLSGNVGIRYVNRDLRSIGNLISGTGVASGSVFNRKDSTWLPSAVAKLELGTNLVIRLGAAKVQAFPNTADLNSGVTLANNAVFVNGVQTVLGTGSGGAPNLDPFKATQYDASFEYYFGEQALVSLGLFYKDVSTFIIQRQSAESYGGVNYLINRRINGDGAKVKGLEALVQLPFYFLPEPLDGFGLLATYSYIDSSTPIRDVAGRVLPFPGLSKNNVNLVAYYEKGPVSLRVAYNWRDEYLLSLSAAATGIYNDKYTDLSATFRYDLSDNITLGLEANNILDQKQRTYDGVVEGLRTNVFFGRVFKASVGVKF